MTKQRTGTREWSTHSVNCCVGCSHGCLYCYARFNAIRYGRMQPGDDWTRETTYPPGAIRDAVQKHRGIVMFPTTHDITHSNAYACLLAVQANLAAGNRVLVVSKASLHVPAILDAARALAGRWGEIELRISLTCLNEGLAGFWEPGAPRPEERLAAIKDAVRRGFAVSLAVEPLLEPDRVVELVARAQVAGVTGQIWIGAANHLRARTVWAKDLVAGLDREIARVLAGQTHSRMHAVYDALKDHPQIRWKDSYTKALTLPPNPTD